MPAVTDPDAPPIREAVAVFSDESDLQAAIDELLSHGFDRAEISLLASEHAVEQKLGHRYRKVTEMEDDANVPRASYVSRESLGDAEGSLIGAPLYAAAVMAAGAIVISGGSLLAAIAGATVAGGVGAAIGSILTRIVSERQARYVQDQLEHGGLLLWVRTWNVDDEKRAVGILRKHSGQDVHVHTEGNLGDLATEGHGNKSRPGAG